MGRVGAGEPRELKYDAWGGFRNGTAPGSAEPSLAYAGQHWDADLGLSYAQQVTLASGEAQLRLCVKQGSFSHDEYTLEAGDAQLLKAVDDETTKGVAGKYRDQPVSLRCEPQSRAPAKPNPAMVDFLVKKQKMTQADAEKTAVAMETVEEGRVCIAREGERELLRVMVLFE